MEPIFKSLGFLFFGILLIPLLYGLQDCGVFHGAANASQCVTSVQGASADLLNSAANALDTGPRRSTRSRPDEFPANVQDLPRKASYWISDGVDEVHDQIGKLSHWLHQSLGLDFHSIA